jgi:hypothetical protein
MDINNHAEGRLFFAIAVSPVYHTLASSQLCEAAEMNPGASCHPMSLPDGAGVVFCERTTA